MAAGASMGWMEAPAVSPAAASEEEPAGDVGSRETSPLTRRFANVTFVGKVIHSLR
jgi:hypothetical protein